MCLYLYITVQGPYFANDYKLCISVKLVVDIPTKILLTILLSIDCATMTQIRITPGVAPKRNRNFLKMGGVKKLTVKYVFYVSEIEAEDFFAFS